MNVAINTICLFDRDRNLFLESDYWLNDFLNKASERTSDSFFLFIEKGNEALPRLANVHYVVFGEMPQSFTRARFWLWYKIKRELKRNACELFIQFGGMPIMTKIPQILVAPDPAYMLRNEELKYGERNYLKSRLPKFYQHVKRIIVESNWERNKMVELFPDLNDKLEIQPPFVPFIQPLSIEGKEQIKEKFSDGNEFFIYSGPVGIRWNLLTLLKAFSAFKKRQRSNMQLLISGKKSSDFEAFEKMWATYKFKEDVKVFTTLSENENQQLMAAAYAGIFPSAKELNVIPVLQMMQSGVPVLAPKDSVVNDFEIEDALYFSPDDVKELSERMMMIYKNENLKAQLSKNGLKSFEKYQQEKSDFRETIF